MDTLNRTIYVENFPLDTQREVLKKLFTHFGRVKHVEMPTFNPEHPINKNSASLKSKGYAFIEFHSKSDADKACSHYNDLENILSYREENSHNKEEDLEQEQEHQNKEEQEEEEESFRANNKQNKLYSDNRYKLMRVMSKKDFREFSRRYDEERYQSLVKASRLFYCS